MAAGSATSSGSVFVRSAPGDGPTVLLLHGYPSSSFDYRMVVPHLAGQAWVTLDFVGFGLSDKPRPHRYSLLEQADVVQSVIAETTSDPVVLIAHDMGTSVATELLARDLDGHLPFELQAAVLTNGSVIFDRASLRPIRKVLRGPLGPVAARLANRGCSARGFAKLFTPQHPLSAEEAAAQWALLSLQRGHRIADLLISYLDERVSVRVAMAWRSAGLVQAARVPVGTRRPGGDHQRARRTEGTATHGGCRGASRCRPLPASRRSRSVPPEGAAPAGCVALSQES